MFQVYVRELQTKLLLLKNIENLKELNICGLGNNYLFWKLDKLLCISTFFLTFTMLVIYLILMMGDYFYQMTQSKETSNIST